MLEIIPLKNHRYAQCGTYMDSYLKPKCGWCMEYGFISYHTKVIIRRGSRIIFTGYYSQTTSKQVGWYLDEHADNLHGLTRKTLKIMARDNLAYDDVTGELEPLTDYELKEIKEIRRKAFNYGYGW